MCGNLVWEGISLADVLLAMYPSICGSASSSLQEWHVVFEGADGYSASTPLARILDKENKVPSGDEYERRASIPRSRASLESCFAGHRRCAKRQVVAIYSASNRTRRRPVEFVLLQKTKTASKFRSCLSNVFVWMLVKYRMERFAYEESPTRAEVAMPSKAYKCLSMMAKRTDAQLIDEDAGAEEEEKHFGWTRFQYILERGAATKICARAIDSSGAANPKISEKQRGYIYSGWSHLCIAEE